MKKYTVELTTEQLKQLGIEVKKYPIFRRSTLTGTIVKQIEDGVLEVVMTTNMSSNKIGTILSQTKPCFDDDNWIDVEYDEENNLWDGQPVLCWDNTDIFRRVIGFYNVKNRRAYCFDGGLISYKHENCEAIQTDKYDKWIIETHDRLKQMYN